ncbi:MAG: enoyl-CoA hydratase/isomerase family protein [Alphaproteobacteria bacterium]|nr:enoyl-CoA hydratase/isomerase family protein [Alphaproteobacteria bacterium]
MTSSDAEQAILFGVADHVATLTLNRPEVRNAVTQAMYARLADLFRQIQDDGDIRCVIVTAADPAFCSGEDLRDMRASSAPSAGLSRMHNPRPEPTAAAMAILDCDRPIIAAINGPAVGWGTELALLADIRIASEQASFATLFVKRGLIADVAGMIKLPRLVGPQKAAEMLFTGDRIDAREAEAAGLVLKCVPHAALMSEARALAARIAVNAPLAVRYTKEALRRSQGIDERMLGSWITSVYGRLFQSADHHEGVASFLEKRPPRFTGR